MHAARGLLDAKLGFFELYQLGDKANVGRNPLSPLGDIGVRRLECPGVGMDEICENYSDRARLACLAVHVHGCRVETCVVCWSAFV